MKIDKKTVTALTRKHCTCTVKHDIYYKVRELKCKHIEMYK